MIAWIIIAIPNTLAQQYLITATGKLTALDNIGQINRFPKTKYYSAKCYYINKRLVHVKTIFNITGKNRADFAMTIFAPVPVFDHPFPDTNKIAAIRNGANIETLVIINDTISTMARLKKMPADSIRLMKFMNPSFVMPKYGDAGKYGALAVVTMGYKITWKVPVVKISPVLWLAIKYSKIISNRLSLSDKKNHTRSF